LKHRIYNYDAEADADLAIKQYFSKNPPHDPITGVTDRELEKYVGWWLPKHKL
jgi:hypothetical protein